MMTRTQLARPVLGRYPFRRGKALVAHLLRFQADQIPDGSLVTTRHGVRVRVHSDAMYSQLYLFGEYEPANTGIFRRLVQPGDTVFDVGANFGWYTANLGHLVGVAGRVHAFEPLAPVAEMTWDTIRLNGLEPRVTLVSQGLGSERGTFTVYTFKNLPHGHASASDLGRADAVPHLCGITTLDAYVAENHVPQINFMKVDVEGHELEVFKGGRQTLSAPEAPVICFEVNLGCLQHRGLRAASLTALLAEYGYTHFWAVDPFGGASPVTRDIGDDNCDYLAAKEPRLQQVRQALGD